MSNRAAYNFLSSISLGGSGSQKKEPTQTTTQPQQSQTHPPTEKPHTGHREHFKAKLTSTLEKKHSIIPHRHDKSQSSLSTPTNPPLSSTPIPTSNPPSTTPTANKPLVHPSSLKRSTSNITISNEYSNHNNTNYSVVRSTSGNSIQNRDPQREPSPREIKSSGSSADGNTVKPRNNSVDQGPVKLRDSGDYGIIRKGSDAGTNSNSTGSTKGRTNSTDQGTGKISESSSSSSSLSSTKLRGDSVDYVARESRRPSEPVSGRARADSMVLGSKDYRKLSKSTSDAGRPTNSGTVVTASLRGASASVLSSSKRDAIRSGKESKEKLISRSQDKTSSPAKIALDRSNKDNRSPPKVIAPSEKEDVHEGPEKLKRHRRKKSKQKSDGHKRVPSAKQNPAALDFLKGISLGENTPTLRKRKSLGKSKLSEVYPRSQDLQKLNDTILFVGSSSTKKIKIADYTAQSVPGKLYLSTRSSSTFAVFSIIKYDAKANRKDKDKSGQKENLSISTIGKLKSVTNAPIVINAPKNVPEVEAEQEMEYDPFFLDDPTLTTGKHRTVMNLPCFKESIIPYVRPGVIKDELNELFRQKHPWVPSGVTLHKIRKLKKALVLIAVAGGLEVSTIAIAYTLFEKLIMKGLVTKPLIRVYGAVCLILAAKSNDPRGDELKVTLEAIEKQLDVEKKELWEYEFPVFAAFSCSLLLPPEHVLPHVRLIIKDHQDLVGNPY